MNRVPELCWPRGGCIGRKDVDVDDFFTKRIDSLSGLGPRVALLTKDCRATPRYDFTIDALVWPDEFPDHLDGLELDALRFVVYFRTHLIIGRTPPDDLRPVWDEARRQIPAWIGFSGERCQPSDSLRNFFDTAQRKANRTFELNLPAWEKAIGEGVEREDPLAT